MLPQRSQQKSQNPHLNFSSPDSVILLIWMTLPFYLVFKHREVYT
ncbi:hypothetical protein AC26_1760 [Escherichia coli 1-176-05_S3_C2]|nr:hypothetical protein AC26_1760 [Escherichia coli 1-176-05_S3_C2]